MAAVAGSAVFGLAAAYAQGPATTYTVTHVVVDGARDSAQAVKHANKTASGVDSGHHEVSLDADATSAEILAAADALSTHSITTGSRYIDAGGEVHNFRSGKRTYWLIVKRDTTPTPMPTPTPTPTPTPAPVSDPDTTYTVTHVRVDGARDSAQAVKDANKTASGVSSGNHEFDLAADATTADILAAANARSTHSITTGSRYIDASGNVHNFQGGKRTYWLITKSEVNVVEPDPDPDRQNVGVNQLTLTGTIADQQLSQGVLYTSATAFPEATGIDGTVTYSVANLPSGIMLNSDRKLTGTPISHLEVTEFTYTATDSDGDTATLTFNLSVLIDYDADNDGLIEVKSLAQLNAIRWDLDGDGVADHAYMQADYAAAFPYPLSGMGCPGTGCKGYELDNDLDFDTNGDGKTNIAGDDYWGDDRGNDSRGWQPIGDRRVPFTAVFDGNDYGISKLYVYKNSSNLAGLFGRIAAGADIRSLELKGGEVIGGAFAGALVAENVGGAINYCRSDVKVSGEVWVGGLVGENWGSIKNSYSTGAVSAGSNTGGLVGSLSGFGNEKITGSYWDTTSSRRSDSAGGTGKTTTELQTPTSNTGIYAGWDANEWNFGTTTQYPDFS